MLDKNDLKQIGVVIEQNNKKLRSEIGGVIEQNNKKLRSEMQGVVEQNNKKIRLEFSEVLEQNNKKLRSEIREEMCEVIKQKLSPAISGLKEKINDLKKEVSKKFDWIESRMLTKDYLDKRISELRRFIQNL